MIHKNKLTFYLIMAILIFTTTGYSQSDSLSLSVKKTYLKVKYDKINSVSAQLSEEWNLRRQAAEEKARQLNIPIITKDANGNKIELQYFEGNIPKYYKSFNLNAAGTISTSDVHSEYGLSGFGITGAVWDAGKIFLDHQEFTGRVYLWDEAQNLSSHATHVAGTMIARGALWGAKGMAGSGELYGYDWNNNLSEITNIIPTVQISNHSYGEVAGWYYSDSLHSWVWNGDVTIDPREDYAFGFYNSTSQQIDNIVSSLNPYHLVVVAAGNDRGEVPPAGSTYLYVDSTGNLVQNGSLELREVDGGGDGYDCIPAGLATAKNTLTVGAVHDIPNGFSYSDQVELTTFSSFGPTDDGRIKPDIVANGFELLSCDTTAVDSYAVMSGTSMAAASVSGSLMLIQEKLGNGYLASTLKALVINTADDADGYRGPDYKTGWGLMNTKKAIDLIEQENIDGKRTHIAEYQYFGNTIEIPIWVEDYDALDITLCYNDPMGTPPAISLNPREPMLINDLDMELEDTKIPRFYYPYKLDPENPTALTITGDNDVDNVEHIHVYNQEARKYILRITHEGFLTNGYQDFSIIVRGGRILKEYTVTITNSFGGGNIIVDGDTVSSGSQFNWMEKSEHTLASYNQEMNGKKWIFENKWTENGSKIWTGNPVTITVPRGNSTFRAEYLEGLNILVDQVDETENRITGSQIYHWQNDQFMSHSVPYQLETFVTATEPLLPEQNLIEGKKFINWEWKEERDVHNLKEFIVESGTDKINSIFNPIESNVLIQNNFAGIHTGEIQIKDPWLKDSIAAAYNNMVTNRGMFAPFKTVPSPFQPTLQSQYKGVFLNQSGPQHNWNPPYYSVRAIEQQQAEVHGEQVDFYFQRWDGTGVQYKSPNSLETPVVFTQAGAVAEAVYKGNRITTNINATGPNGAKNLFKDATGVYHLVYEDNGNIYYTNSTDLKTWSKEEAVLTTDNYDEYHYLYPSIYVEATSGQSPLLLITATSCYYDRNTNEVWYDYLLSQKTGSSQNWNDITINVFQSDGSLGFVPYAVVSKSTYSGISRIIISYPLEVNNQPVLTSTFVDPENFFIEKTETVSTGGYNPSMAASPSGSYTVLAYEKNRRIYARLTEYDNPSSWGPETEVSSGMVWVFEHHKPSISFNNSVAVVSWEGKYEHGTNGIFARRLQSFRDELQLNYPLLEIEQSRYDVKNSSVSLITEDNIRIYYEKQGKVKYRELNDSYLVNEQTYASGYYPSVTQRSGDAVFVQHYSSLPYLVKSTAEFGSSQQTFAKEGSADSTVLVESKRFTYVQDSDYLSFYFQHFTLGDQSLYLDSALYSNPVTITSSGEKLYANLSYLVGGEVSFDNPDQVLFAVNFDDGTTTYRLQSFTVADIRTIMSNDSLGEGISEISISGMSGKSGRLFITFPHVQPLVSGVIVESNDVQLAKGSVPSEPTSHQVTEFSLGVNYPNPFNPTTTIPFALPEDGHVQLIIYNTAGQKVRTLINAPLKRGTHSALWDGLTDNGSQVASGIYLYRFIYRDVDGKQIVKSRKMLLLK